MSVRLVKRGMNTKIDALRTLSEQITTDTMDDEKTIDFGNVGLYLAGLQICFAIVCCSCCSVLSCWMLPANAISAVRTLAITTTIGLLLVRKPIRVGRARGVITIFNALRPSVGVYVLALVLEQLVHTCVVPEATEDTGAVRRAIYHVISVFLVISGLARSKNPRSESDMPFLVAMVCLIATALLPPPAIAKSGPLCEPTSLLGAGERVLRALLFAAVYVVLVYSAAPSRNVSNELFICVARATAASIWVLSATAWALPLAPLQVAIALFSRLGEDAEASTTIPQSVYEQLPLNGNTTPMAGGSIESDLELGSADLADPEGIKRALQTQRAVHHAGNGLPDRNQLTFNFSGPRVASASPELNMAAIAAREAGNGG